MPSRALARVNLAAIERNVRHLRRGLTPGTALCAVVKADGYGHGAEPVARAALRAGASSLAVATADEAAALRSAGIGGAILVMGAISADELPIALAAGADVTAWSERFVSAVARHGRARVHVKLDSGLGRLGTRDVGEAVRVAERVVESPGLELAGAMTHFATADGDLEFVAEQLERFRPFVSALRRLEPRVVVAHAANSAGALRVPASHFDMVRCGIAIYGCDPMNEDPDRFGLEPALELGSYVAAVKLARPGESAGYGRRFIAQHDTWLGTIPLGYGDGFRRAFTNNCDVLVAGRRYPVVGTVSMDNITVELGPEPAVRVGEPVTIIGRDGAERQTAEELALRIHTINYEIVCGLSPRVPRVYHRDGEPCER
jgi:alanine racemase